MIVPDPVLVLQHNSGSVVLPEMTLVISIDDTGDDIFSDKNFPVFGLAGCAVLVRDYQHLVEIPWLYMKKTYFPEVAGPLHAAELRKLSEDQIKALGYFFEKFQFFRVASLASASTANTTDFRVVQIVCEVLLQRICEIGKWIPFDRIALIIEESQRLEMDLIRFLSGKKIRRNGVDAEVELFLMPKKACFPALEVADFIAHTAGTQTRNRISGVTTVRKDFQAIFHNIDPRLASFNEITGIT